MDMLVVLIIFCGLFVGWTIGTNDAANCLGTAVGAGLISCRKAVYIVGVMALLGAVISGRAVAKTIGSGIVDASLLPMVSILAVLLAAGVYVTIMTLLSLPVSTTQSVLGGIAGIGILLDADVQWVSFAGIFLLGFLTPVIALVCSFLIYKMYERIAVLKPFLFLERFLGLAVVISGAFLAYSMGGNNLGNAMGLVVGSGTMEIFTATVCGGVAMGIGSVTLGQKVMKTVGSEITLLSAPTAFSAQAGSAIAIYLLTVFGIPTSTSFGIVGGITGVGLVKGMVSLRVDTLMRILIAWVLTPIFSGLFAMVIYKALKAAM